MSRHVWGDEEDPHWTRCGYCGARFYVHDPDCEDEEWNAAIADAGILQDCDQEKVRQVMDS